MHFAIPGDQRLKIKESNKIDWYLDPATELKNRWIMKVTVIPIIVGAAGIVKTD